MIISLPNVFLMVVSIAPGLACVSSLSTVANDLPIKGMLAPGLWSNAAVLQVNIEYGCNSSILNNKTLVSWSGCRVLLLPF